jgi:dihydroorotate dehydrogenase (NAD+) catalytic subunit
VIEFLIAGASAVQIGTMNFVNPAASGELLHGLQNYLESENITINELIGSIQLPSN